MEIFTFIKEVWAVAGFLGLLAVTLMASVIIVAAALGKDFVMALFKKLQDRWNKTKVVNFAEHTIFYHLKLMIDHQIPVIDIRCPLRNRIFKKLLDIKLKDFRTCVEALTNRFTQDDDLDLSVAFIAMFIEHNHNWTESAKRAGVPEAAITKFNEFYNAYSKPLESIVQDLASSQKLLVNNKAEKLNIILDIIKSMIVASYLASEKTLNSLNGEISSVVFEGEKCRNCQPKCDIVH